MDPQERGQNFRSGNRTPRSGKRTPGAGTGSQKQEQESRSGNRTPRSWDRRTEVEIEPQGRRDPFRQVP